MLLAPLLTVALTSSTAATPPPAAWVHCARCHAAPDPSLIAAEDWPATVAWMGAYLGHPPEDPRVAGAIAGSLVPATPLVTQAELTAIRDWLVAQAPPRAHRAVPAVLPRAPVEAEPTVLDPGPGRLVTLLAVEGGFASAGCAHPAALRLSDRNGTLLLAAPMPSEPVGASVIGERVRLSLLGHWDGDAGAGMVLDLHHDAAGLRAQPVVAEYHRLAGHVDADLDGDGHGDLILLGFGDTPLGRFAVLWGGTPSREDILFAESGVVGAVVMDVDGDGLLDLVAAFAQQHNRLVWFRQTRPRHFAARVILQRPIGWGYNQLLAADLDGSGRPLLITVAGNNMELPDPPLKPHHGLRILALEPDGTVRERAFIPLPGATRCAVGDVDGDGRLDLVATALHPDWRAAEPLTALIALQAAGDVWQTYRLPRSAWHRWLTVAIEPGPGPARILLGGAPFTVGMDDASQAQWVPQWQNQASVLALRWQHD